ncbi:MAG: hypothetical protein ACLUMK_12580 [Christensenellales bacterium]
MSDTYEIKQDDGAVNVIAVENGAVYIRKPTAATDSASIRAK